MRTKLYFQLVQNTNPPKSQWSSIFLSIEGTEIRTTVVPMQERGVELTGRTV